MKAIFIIAVLLAVAALLLIARKEQHHKKFAYGVAAAIAIIGALLFFILFPASPPRELVDETARKESFLENRQEQAETLTKRLEDNPDDVDAVLALSLVLMEQTKYEQALDILAKALEKNPENPNLLQQRAVAQFAHALFLAEHKKNAEALVALKKAKDFAPKDAPFIGHIDLFIDVLEARINPKAAAEKQAKITQELREKQNQAKQPAQNTAP